MVKAEVNNDCDQQSADIITRPYSLENFILDTRSLNNQLKECMLSDVFRFRRRLQKIKQEKSSAGQSGKQVYDQIVKDIERSVATAETRKQNIPVITYPDELPIAQKSELIKKTIVENQVMILCGETG